MCAGLLYIVKRNSFLVIHSLGFLFLLSQVLQVKNVPFSNDYPFLVLKDCRETGRHLCVDAARVAVLSSERLTGVRRILRRVHGYGC